MIFLDIGEILEKGDHESSVTHFLKSLPLSHFPQTVPTLLLSVRSFVFTDIFQGFQSGPVPGTFTRLRSCTVPAEITEPPKLVVVKTTSTMVDRLVEYFS